MTTISSKSFAAKYFQMNLPGEPHWAARLRDGRRSRKDLNPEHAMATKSSKVLSNEFLGGPSVIANSSETSETRGPQLNISESPGWAIRHRDDRR